MSEIPKKSRADLIVELNSQSKPDLTTNAPGMPAATPQSNLDALGQPPDGVPRFQHAIINVGTFNNADRMAQVLATASRAGWELVTIYDKASNWVGGWEKGFMLLKRPVPEGTSPQEWCVTIRS